MNKKPSWFDLYMELDAPKDIRKYGVNWSITEKMMRIFPLLTKEEILEELKKRKLA